jgi:transposase-like protein
MASIPSNYQCRLLVECIVFGKDCLCPQCRNSLKRGKNYSWCKICRKKWYPKSLTWLRGSKVSYQQLFLLIRGWQSNTPPGGVKNLVGLSYPTIARWYSRFREHLPRDKNLLDGIVEVDESYFGRKKYGNQEIVIGAVVRELKRLKLKWIPNACQDELEDFVWEAVAPTSKLHTDCNPGYYDLHSWGYGHYLWNHSDGHFTGTNNIENVWSVIKRQIRRLYGQIRTNKLPEFIVEWEARVNFPHLFEDPKTYLQETLFAVS